MAHIVELSTEKKKAKENFVEEEKFNEASVRNIIHCHVRLNSLYLI
jgi:hypothetical protein